MLEEWKKRKRRRKGKARGRAASGSREWGQVLEKEKRAGCHGTDEDPVGITTFYSLIQMDVHTGRFFFFFGFVLIFS